MARDPCLFNGALFPGPLDDRMKDNADLKRGDGKESAGIQLILTVRLLNVCKTVMNTAFNKEKI